LKSIDLLEPPTSILWTILFLAQHHDQIGETQKALDLIDEAIAHTPTVVDIYAFRAEIYKVYILFNNGIYIWLIWYTFNSYNQ